MGKKRRIIAKPQKFGKKYHAHPAATPSETPPAEAAPPVVEPPPEPKKVATSPKAKPEPTPKKAAAKPKKKVLFKNLNKKTDG